MLGREPVLVEGNAIPLPLLVDQLLYNLAHHYLLRPPAGEALLGPLLRSVYDHLRPVGEGPARVIEHVNRTGEHPYIPLRVYVVQRHPPGLARVFYVYVRVEYHDHLRPGHQPETPHAGAAPHGVPRGRLRLRPTRVPRSSSPGTSPRDPACRRRPSWRAPGTACRSRRRPGCGR